MISPSIVGTVGHVLQAVVGDHRAHAVRDGDERTLVGGGMQRLDEPAADLVARFVARAGTGGRLEVEEVVVRVAHQARHHAVAQPGRHRHALLLDGSDFLRVGQRRLGCRQVDAARSASRRNRASSSGEAPSGEQGLSGPPHSSISPAARS